MLFLFRFAVLGDGKSADAGGHHEVGAGLWDWRRSCDGAGRKSRSEGEQVENEVSHGSIMNQEVRRRRSRVVPVWRRKYYTGSRMPSANLKGKVGLGTASDLGCYFFFDLRK